MRKDNICFFSSIFIGIFLWFFFFIITPIGVKNSLSTETIAFIILCYLCLVLGFLFSKRINFRNNYVFNFNKSFEKKTLYVILTLVLISFMFRYYDLFFIREIFLNNDSTVNKIIAGNPDNFSLFFSFLSFFRVLYFVPIIFLFNSKLENKWLLLICLFLFLLPLLEGFLRDSRRVFFESIGILSAILIYFGKINYKSIKTYAIFVLVVSALISYSLFVVKGRTNGTEDNFYENIFNSPYNDFVPPKEKAINFLEKNKNKLIAQVYFSEIHIGQYIVHGVYEMDYMISNFHDHYLGMHNLYLGVKFFNKLGLTEIPLKDLNNPTKRNTYITFFGGLYIDFGWFSLIVMFFYGFIQRKLMSGKQNSIFSPLVIIFLFTNIFLLVMNFIRAQFLFTSFIYLFFLINYTLARKVFNSSKELNKQ